MQAVACGRLSDLQALNYRVSCYRESELRQSRKQLVQSGAVQAISVAFDLHNLL